MSIICQTFVQNAWRSDLCSNCFKCLDEHSNSGRSCDRMSSTQRYMPQATSLYQSRGISSTLKWRLSEPIYERVARRDFGSQTTVVKTNQQQQRNVEQRSRGILITAHDKKLRSRPSVDFASEEALVIGYGGNDYDSDQSPWEMGSDDGSIDLDLLDDTDEDRKISKLTRNNTEFNSFNKNLTSSDDTSSSRRQKKQEDKLNSINNNKNSPQKTSDRSLNILTHNDIQPQKAEKKLNQFYFPCSMQPLKSYLHNGNGNTVNIHEKTSSERSPVVDNSKVENCKREVVKINNGNCRNILNDDFTPLNTQTYSFVSELNKNNTSSEHSSDSDYSTCRLTAGDSTDSESFQDAEEARILPCSSFLHGNFPPRGLPQPNSLESDKKYDGGSSTSGDVSNLSDDSDTSERTSYKSRNIRSSKISQNDPKRSVKEIAPSGNHVIPEKKAPVPSNNKHTADEKVSVKNSETTVAASTEKVTGALSINLNDASKQAESHTLPSERVDKQIIKKSETISMSVDSKYRPNVQHNKSTHSPAPNPPVDVNLRNIITVNGSLGNLKENTISDGQSQVTKSKSSPPRTPRSAEKDGTTIVSNFEPVPDKEKKSHPSDNDDGPNAVSKLPKDIPFDKEPSDEDDGTDYEKSPDAINNRQSKLAALALELELARRDSAMKSSNGKVPPSLPLTPPEVKAQCSLQNITYTPTSPAENFPTIKKGSAISCTSRLATLPDVLQETPTKTKKNKFSLKKLLKRNKDSGTFTPTGKEVNPKAWKKQTFDRSRLSLEIVHPMDLTNDPTTSGDSTPTEENQYMVSNHPGRSIFRGGYSRARSLSALPQLSGDEQSNCSLLECKKMDTLPARKAGTVAERKKNRPPLVRTPSCSALPNRPAGNSDQQRTPPPKPPPPPKCKVMHPPPPPPPPHQPRIKPPTSSTPQRPPPPKIPDGKSRTLSGDASKPEVREQSNSDKEYANLGDIRSLLTPVKPQRPSALSVPHRENEKEDPYETLQQIEEDHYTYLDETELRSPKKSLSSSSIYKASSPKSSGPTCGRPWLDLQTSYAAIAAANYESLAEIITTSMSETMEYFQNAGKSLRWQDFTLQAGEPQTVHHNRSIYNGIYKPKEQEKIMLLVIPRKQTSPPNTRNQTRYPVLASFTDYIPKSNTPNPSSPGMEWASLYVLRRSRIVTVSQFANNTASDLNNQHIHLRNYCFVLLQLIHTLKSLQAEGTEEINCDLERLILVTTHEDKPPIFVLFPEDKNYLTLCDSIQNRKTLCQATLVTLFHFLQINNVDDLASCKVNGEHLAEAVAHTFRAIAKVLLEEKASSLSQAKGLLEYMLWGPVDVKISECEPARALDTVLQRWLDLQRAQMVKSTISQLQHKANSHLHIYEEYQLVFLLQASVKSLKSVISKL